MAPDRAPIEWREGQLALGAPRSERVTRMLDGNGFVATAAVGDVVSIHWNWVCEVLDGAQLRALARYTAHHLRLANQTI